MHVMRWNLCVTMFQVSVLTDQVEVQGEKIRDLETCLEHHQGKLNATEDLLQQVTLQGIVYCALVVLSLGLCMTSDLCACDSSTV